MNEPNPTPGAEDPLLRSARREAKVTLLIFAAALTYTLTVCWLFGYGRDPATLRFVFGFPDWVFWGVVVPWAVCLAIGYWFAFHFMSSDELKNATEVDDELFGDG